MANPAQQPLISVIVPVYNVEPYLRTCVDSILSQTYQNLEIILVDDGSPDRCPVICDEYAKQDPRVIVIHKPNGGPSSARNIGLKVFHGEFLMFVDSDDWLGNFYIEELFRSIDGANVAISGCTYTSEDGSPYQIKHSTSLSFRDLISNSLFGYVGTKLYRRSVISGKEFDSILREDMVFNLRLICAPFSRCFRSAPTVEYYYRQQKNSILHFKKPFPSEDMYNAINQLATALDQAILSCDDRTFAYNCIMYTLLTDAFSRLSFLKENSFTEKEYIRYVFSAIPSKKLSPAFADNNLFKATWFAHRFGLISPYLWLLKLIHRKKPI